ncbi:hypothetical protein M0R45_015014 [Rubus argutus]|uniref:Uncharacterized protein n=1 Tax=Rubus argutus TaxID=59490 RepID=A0AAW1XQM5_RUBAR
MACPKPSFCPCTITNHSHPWRPQIDIIVSRIATVPPAIPQPHSHNHSNASSTASHQLPKAIMVPNPSSSPLHPSIFRARALHLSLASPTSSHQSAIPFPPPLFFTGTQTSSEPSRRLTYAAFNYGTQAHCAVAASFSSLRRLTPHRLRRCPSPCLSLL